MNGSDSSATNVQFNSNERELRKHRAIVALGLGVALMPAGIFPDWILYREAFANLLIVRIVSTAILALGLIAILKIKLDRAFEPLSFFLISSPAFALALMMYLTDGGRSTYYFGLILLMIIVHLLGFRTGEAILFSLLTVVAYLVAIFSHPAIDLASRTEVTQGVFFLVTSAVVCIFISHFSRRNRWIAFQLQSELRDERIQLEKSMRQLRETELQLFQSEKVRAIAGLASGLLHEINNPVNFSLMAVRVLKKRLSGMPSEMETLSDIEDGVDRIGEIVSDLRSFAYSEHEEVTQPFLLRGAIDTAVRFSVNEVESGVIQIVDGPAMESRVIGTEGQVVQVFLNLICNASRALNKKPDAKKRIEISAAKDNDRVSIMVRDWGIGMSAEKVESLFGPSSLERTSEGLGLGVSICNRIIKSHGGQLSFTSQFGEGTQVTFDLPLEEQQRGQHAISNTPLAMKQNGIFDHKGLLNEPN